MATNDPNEFEALKVVVDRSLDLMLDVISELRAVRAVLRELGVTDAQYAKALTRARQTWIDLPSPLSPREKARALAKMLEAFQDEPQ